MFLSFFQKNEYKKALDKHNPLDKAILDLTTSGNLTISIHPLKDDTNHKHDPYSYNTLPPKGKHTA